MQRWTLTLCYGVEPEGGQTDSRFHSLRCHSGQNVEGRFEDLYAEVDPILMRLPHSRQATQEDVITMDQNVFRPREDLRVLR